MDWRDQGTLIVVRPHGETSAIIDVFTESHGRHAGVVRGGSSRRLAPLLQPGAQLDLAWRARLDAHIGTFNVEPLRGRSAILGDRDALAALNAVCAILHRALPEREPHPMLYRASIALLDSLGDGAGKPAESGWALEYLHWELRVLEDLGYGLDLGRCALSGAQDDLAYVSPTSGRAVARAAAGDWAPRLLPLPPCLLGQGPASRAEIRAGLTTTGHFLARLMADLGRELPEARARLLSALSRS